MATPEQLAERAIGLARGCLDDLQEELKHLADEELPALLDAANIVRRTKEHLAEIERGVEHMAFTLLTTAFARARAERNGG